MQCLRRTSSAISKEPDRELTGCLEKDIFNSSSKDPEASCIGWTDPEQRCTCLTFFALGHDGQWKIVAVPIGHRPQVVMGPAAPGNSVNANRFRNKGIGNKNFVPKEEKEKEKSRKKSSKKKKKKKGKWNKQRSDETSLTELERGPGDDTKCQTGANSATKLEDSQQEDINNGTSSEGSSCIEEVGLPESLTLSVLPSQHQISAFESGIQTNYPEIEDSSLNGEVFGSNGKKSISDGEKINSGRKGNSLSEMLSKSVKNIKNVSQNSSQFWKLNGQFGRENNHSVWQKVQRNKTYDGNSVAENGNSTCSQSVESKETLYPKNQRNVVSPSINLLPEVEKKTNTKVSGKVKWKSNPESKQEGNNYKKGPQGVKAPPSLGTKVIDMQQNEEKVNKTIFQRKKVEPKTVKPLESSQACLNEVVPLESVCVTASRLNSQGAEGQTSLSLKPYSCPGPPELLEKLVTIDKEAFPVDHKQEANTTGAPLQKWIPVGVRRSDSQGLVHATNSSVTCVGPISNNVNGSPSKNVGQHKNLRNQTTPGVKEYSNNIGVRSSDSQRLVRATNSSVMCAGPSSNDVNDLLSKNVGQLRNLRNQTTPSVEEYSNNYGGAKCFSPELKDPTLSTSDINSVVNDAYRAQLNSEAIQLAMDFPIAEFEKLLHSASPIICPSQSIGSCKTCSSRLDVVLCGHQRPNITLAKLWQWYEKHGSYGLEIRAEDYQNSKRLGMDSVAFRAYFVPYLSAVQLFAKRKVSGTRGSSAVKAESSILSVLIPKPQAESVREDDLDLLFEYFESEQPQRRRPLFEMIKELVRRDAPSQCRAYGDATVLNSASLHDLHPQSWYSVAWYPIYRIPGDNFRAAFLTYHSLGHLVHRQPAVDSACSDACIVSPVVGLQSYNAQDECWFRLRQSAADIENLNSNPAEVLKERLRTLEQTASLMARGVVTKGNDKSANRQPDYEFFLSRKRS